MTPRSSGPGSPWVKSSCTASLIVTSDCDQLVAENWRPAIAEAWFWLGETAKADRLYQGFDVAGVRDRDAIAEWLRQAREDSAGPGHD
jgi:hypothetical protein